MESLRSALAGRKDVRLALILGSAARGRQTADSDLDVVVLAPNTDLLALGAELMRACHRDVDVVSLADASIPLLEEIVRDAIVIHESTPGQFAAFRSRALIDLETDRPWYRRMCEAWLRRVADTGLSDGQP
jgi:predicted nucleotidyltransferase